MSNIKRSRKIVRFDTSPFPKQSMLNVYDPGFTCRQATPSKSSLREPPFKRARYELREPPAHGNNNLYLSVTNSGYSSGKFEWAVLKVKNSIKLREKLSESGKQEIYRMQGRENYRLRESTFNNPKIIPLHIDYRNICIGKRSPQILQQRQTNQVFTPVKPANQSSSHETPVHLQFLMSRLKSSGIIPSDELPETSTSKSIPPNCKKQLSQPQRKEVRNDSGSRSCNYLCHYFMNCQQGCMKGDLCKNIHDEEKRKQCMAKRQKKSSGSAHGLSKNSASLVSRKQNEVGKCGKHTRKRNQPSRSNRPSMNRQINNNNPKVVRPEATIKINAPSINSCSDTQLGYLNLEL